jgi:hypothetical protein
MKLNRLSLACGAALLGVSAGASAQVLCGAAPCAVQPFDTPQITVFLSGASAPQNGIGELTEQLFDKTQGFYVYLDSSSNAASFRTYFGRIRAGVAGAAAGQTVRLINRARGGSVFGVNPVAKDQLIDAMLVSAAGCTVRTTNLISGLTGVNQWYTCPESGTNDNPANAGAQRPDFGVSDVAPFMFKAPFNVELGAAELSTGQLAGLTSRVSSGLMFGVTATNSVPSNLYIGRQIYGQLISGFVRDWTQLRPSLTGSNQVVVCRRVPGSGTQATYNWYFQAFPSAVGAALPNSPTIAVEADSAGYPGTIPASGNIVVDASAGFTVIENPSSGNVRTCLQTAQNGGTYTINKLFRDPTCTAAGVGGCFQPEDGLGLVRTRTFEYRFPAAGAPYKAVGNLSLDSSGQENGWTFRALEGGTGTLAISVPADTLPPVFSANGADPFAVGPTRGNLVEGTYDFVGEITYQYVTTKFNGFAQAKRDFISDFITRSGDPAVLNAIQGVQGVRAAYCSLPTNGFAPTLDAQGVVTNNVCRADRAGNQIGPMIRQF